MYVQNQALYVQNQALYVLEHELQSITLMHHRGFGMSQRGCVALQRVAGPYFKKHCKGFDISVGNVSFVQHSY